MCAYKLFQVFPSDWESREELFFSTRNFSPCLFTLCVCISVRSGILSPYLALDTDTTHYDSYRIVFVITAIELWRKLQCPRLLFSPGQSTVLSAEFWIYFCRNMCWLSLTFDFQRLDWTLNIVDFIKNKKLSSHESWIMS